MKSCRRLRAMLALLAILIASPSAAALIDNGSTMIDTATNLQWLDLNITLGQSVNTALAANPGYALATDVQVAQLFTNAGFADLIAGATATDGAAAQTMINFLGCTASSVVCSGRNAYGRGFASNTQSTSTLISPTYRIASVPNNGGDAVLSLFSFDPDQAFADRGVYLVAAIPEPSAALLLAVGFALAIGRLRRQT